MVSATPLSLDQPVLFANADNSCAWAATGSPTKPFFDRVVEIVAENVYWSYMIVKNAVFWGYMRE